MAESIKQFMQEMVTESKGNSSAGDDNYELPDKDISDFSIDEMHDIMLNHPVKILELFERSGWLIDDAGRKAVSAALRNSALDSIPDINAVQKEFDKLSEIEKEVVIIFKALVLATLSDHLYQGVHIIDKDNPIKAPKYADDVNYETLLVFIDTAKDGIGMVMNTVNKTRVVTSNKRAKEYYTDGFLNQVEADGYEIITYETSVSEKDDDPNSDKVVINVFGRYFNGDRLSVSSENLLTSVAMDKIRKRMRKDILKGFRQDDDDGNENDDDDDDDIESDDGGGNGGDDGNNGGGNNDLSSRLKFKGWD